MTKRNKLEKQSLAQQKKVMSKKALKEQAKAQRCVVPMNTGTRTHKTAKDYDRKKSKQATRKAMMMY